MAPTTIISIRIELVIDTPAEEPGAPVHEVSEPDLERWIFDADELRPWPPDASIRCAPSVHGLCTDEAEQA